MSMAHTPSSEIVRVMIVDDHEIVRRGIAEIIDRADGLDVVAEAGSRAEAVRRALEVGGTSFDALYVDVEGAAGFFARELGAYGRQGLGCRRCGATMARETLAGRSHTYCPHCQTRPRRRR